MDPCDEKEGKHVTNKAPEAKRIYTKPEVIEFGDIRALTLGPGVGSKADAFTGIRRP